MPISVTVLALLLGAVCLALLALHLRWMIGLDEGPSAAAYAGLMPYWLAAAWPVLAFGVGLRRWWLAALAAPVVLAQTAAITRRSNPPPGRRAPGVGTSLRVVTANLYWRNDRAAETWSAIEAAQPDLVLLQEVSTRSGTFLPPSGWFARVFAHDADAFGTAVLSRLPVADTREVLIGGRGQLRTEVTLAGVRIVIWSVHPIAPVSRTKDRIWRTQLAEFGEHFASERGPLVVGGDLNATGDHHPFQELLRTTGLTDALPSSRRAWATWPARWSAFPPSPPRTMALDHVLVRGLAVTRVRRLAAGRSDHHPVCADLVLDSIIDVDVN